MNPFKIIALIWAVFTIESASANQVVRIESAQSDDNVSHVYYQDLLVKILQNTEAEYGPMKVETFDMNVSQSRGLQLLDSDVLDVFWAGTSQVREQQYGAIPIPLVGGLLGLRVPVIRQQNLALFESITEAEQLKKLKACQGSQWPDSDILAHNGYTLERVISFNLMYSMLRQGRCDYFPRGVNEVYAELTAPSNQSLIAYEGLLLHYPLPIYFFVNKQKTELHQRLTLGLTRLVEQGELKTFILQHPTTKDIFPLSRFNQSRIFELTNPTLPEHTPVDNRQLWWGIEPQ
ncbi:hypothetical protein [Shewanella gaetbuli]|uniref:Bacterial extracellular solute-binding proteins, family 3 n=1 Tax=Shewanella gaetbuli TaxID=220752 RepID=A0A9X2CN11_9GAMM|nr:hypothetical protein [Shewanella gaetbuli]MCL1144214.1 hypothetical protein [Shewanella gaetbuli]